MKRFDEAIAAYERALRLKPGEPEWLVELLHSRLKISDWSTFAEETDRIAQAVKTAGAVVNPFPLLSLSNSPDVQRIAAEAFTRAKFPPPVPVDFSGRRTASGKIRLGYFSADFGEHPLSYLAAGLFEAHDRSTFEVYGFSLKGRQGPTRARVAAAFDRFVDVESLSDDAAAALARGMGLDIAVDLGGHTEHARPGLFAHRAAPVQAAYLGFLGTSGADFVDYAFADRVLVRPGEEGLFSEKLAFLPRYQVNDRARPRPAPSRSRAERGLPGNAFVFCCFNNANKTTPDVFASWMTILRACPGSVLWLAVDEEAGVRNLRRQAARLGVDGGRLVFAGRVEYRDYLASLGMADLFLDTSPYNAGTTASDAVWMGLPVLTRPGATVASKVKRSQRWPVALKLSASTSQCRTLSASAAGIAVLQPKCACSSALPPQWSECRWVLKIRSRCRPCNTWRTSASVCGAWLT
jgi:predicted O-linked N-acetylglucosamine transferase (SPINDLY family)